MHKVRLDREWTRTLRADGALIISGDVVTGDIGVPEDHAVVTLGRTPEPSFSHSSIFAVSVPLMTPAASEAVQFSGVWT